MRYGTDPQEDPVCEDCDCDGEDYPVSIVTDEGTDEEDAHDCPCGCHTWKQRKRDEEWDRADRAWDAYKDGQR